MVGLDGDILGLFDIVHALEDGEPVTDAGDAHAFEIIVQQRHQGLPHNVVVCRTCHASLASKQAHMQAFLWCARRLHTYELIRVLPQPDGRYKVGTFLGRPLRDNGLW